MLSKESLVTRSSNSQWSILKIFNIYNSGYRSRGRTSFIIIGSIKRRRYINPNRRRFQIAHKAFGCITNTVNFNCWIDGQTMSSSSNKVAALSQRIRRSRLKIKGLIFFSTKRMKYLKHAINLV